MPRVTAPTIWAVTACCCVLAWPAPVRAQDPLHKAGRGAANMLASWTEIIKQIHNGAGSGNPVAGVLRGTARGVELTVLRLGVGAYEILSAPVPIPRRYASPYGRFGIPDYPWE